MERKVLALKIKMERKDEANKLTHGPKINSGNGSACYTRVPRRCVLHTLMSQRWLQEWRTPTMLGGRCVGRVELQ